MPKDLLYSKTHEWVRVETDPAGGKIATVGLTAFAWNYSPIWFTSSCPPVGRPVKAGEPFGEIESVKAVSDLYSPVDGAVAAVNAALADHLDHLADDPYQAGWFIKIKIADEAGLADLLDEAAYKKQCEEEQH